jgi:RNA polymerase sigma factor for flagellar operon FliA
MQNHGAPLSSDLPTPAWSSAPPDRDDLVQQALPLVNAVAERLRRRYTLTASFEDLSSMGMAGLATAVDRFDPSRGVSFITFAYHKIRGAILDGLRRSDRQYSFQLRCRLTAERRVAEQLRFDDDFLSSSSEGRVDKATDVIASSMSHVATLHLASLSGGGAEHAPTDPDEVVLQREVRDRVQNAIASLPEKERELIRLCYYGDGSLADVAAHFGMSRAWATRAHQRALSALRKALAALGDDAPDSVAPPTDVSVEAGTPSPGRPPMDEAADAAAPVPSLRDEEVGRDRPVDLVRSRVEHHERSSVRRSCCIGGRSRAGTRTLPHRHAGPARRPAPDGVAVGPGNRRGRPRVWRQGRHGDRPLAPLPRQFLESRSPCRDHPVSGGHISFGLIRTRGSPLHTAPPDELPGPSTFGEGEATR